MCSAEMPITERVTNGHHGAHLNLRPWPSVFGEMVHDGGEEEDYFAHFEELEFTEEDLARLDRICEGEPHVHIPEPVLPYHEFEDKPLVTIEVEQELQPASEVVSLPTSSPHTPMSTPPYDAFRSGKSLSVSDLTGPLW